MFSVDVSNAPLAVMSGLFSCTGSGHPILARAAYRVAKSWRYRESVSQ
jgi:hypothetical protein